MRLPHDLAWMDDPQYRVRRPMARTTRVLIILGLLALVCGALAATQ